MPGTAVHYFYGDNEEYVAISDSNGYFWYQEEDRMGQMPCFIYWEEPSGNGGWYSYNFPDDFTAARRK